MPAVDYELALQPQIVGQPGGPPFAKDARPDVLDQTSPARVVPTSSHVASRLDVLHADESPRSAPSSVPQSQINNMGGSSACEPQWRNSRPAQPRPSLLADDRPA